MNTSVARVAKPNSIVGSTLWAGRLTKMCRRISFAIQRLTVCPSFYRNHNKALWAVWDQPPYLSQQLQWELLFQQFGPLSLESSLDVHTTPINWTDCASIPLSVSESDKSLWSLFLLEQISCRNNLATSIYISHALNSDCNCSILCSDVLWDFTVVSSMFMSSLLCCNSKTQQAL